MPNFISKTTLSLDLLAIMPIFTSVDWLIFLLHNSYIIPINMRLIVSYHKSGFKKRELKVA